jgi:hypothetical protein
MNRPAMPPRTGVFIGAVCLITGWLLGSLLVPPVASVQALPERRSAQPAAAATPAPEPTGELRWTPRRAPALRTSTRNPFVFGDRTPSSGRSAGEDRTSAAVVSVAAESIEPPAPSGPLLALSGVATRDTPQGRVYIAVLSDGTTVHLARAGESVAGYAVVDVTEDGATLADASGGRVVLRLPR